MGGLPKYIGQKHDIIANATGHCYQDTTHGEISN